MTHLSTKVERVIAGLVLGISFLVMASIIVPHNTQATPAVHRETHPAPTHLADPTRPGNTADSGSTDPHEGLFQIGSIESTCYLVHIYAGESQPLYTVIDAYDGRQLGTLLTAEQVEARFPELPLTSTDFSADDDDQFAPRIIMLADPAELDFH